MEILTGVPGMTPEEWADVVASTSGDPELTRRMLEETRQRERKGTPSMDPELWAELLRINGGSAEMAMRMLLELQAVQGGEEPEITNPPMPRPPVVQPPMPRPAPRPMPRPSGLGTQAPIPIPRPAGGGYDPLSSMNVPTSGGGGGGSGFPPGPLPPAPFSDATMGGPDMRDRFDINLRNQLHGTPPPVSTPGQTGPIPPVGRVSDEFVRPPVPASPPTAPAVAAQPAPTVSSSGGGGSGGDWMGPPMPRPNQQTMDGGIWAALRAAFANNEGNNERLALERMIASRGGANS